MTTQTNQEIQINARLYKEPTVNFPLSVIRKGKKVVGFLFSDPTTDLESVTRFSRQPSSKDWEEVTADVIFSLKQLGAELPNCWIDIGEVKEPLVVGEVTFNSANNTIEFASSDAFGFLCALNCLTHKGNPEWVRDVAHRAIPLVSKSYGVGFGIPNGGRAEGTDGFRW